jgi:hypothetical protein
MKNNYKHNLHFYIVINGELSKDDFTFGSLQAPTNLQVAVELIGKTANPNGDGSGKVKFTAADDAISYVFPDGTSSNAPSGFK